VRARWFVRLPDGDRRSLLRFNRISARSMAQQTASGSWSVHRAAGADVDCVRHRSPVICSIARFIGHGSLVPAGDFGVAGGPSSRRSSYRCRRRSCCTAVSPRPIDVRFGAHNGLKSGIMLCPKRANFGSDAFTHSAPCHLLRFFKMPSSLPTASLTNFRRPCRCLEIPRLKVRCVARRTVASTQKNREYLC
jgi:hypothetical protein